MPAKEQGFVLLAVLFFMQIYTLIGVSALEQATLAMREGGEQRRQAQLLNEAERLLRQLEVKVDLQNASCLLAVKSPGQWQMLPLSWWQQYACTGSSADFRYYYVIEDLGVDPCGKTRQTSGWVAHYYRLSLLLMKVHDEYRKIVLQSTMIKESQALEPCAYAAHYLPLGRQSWRELQ